jgi:DNA-binding response OmpR family regulator
VKVLIIEDEPALNKAMADYLKSQQYVCECAWNFRQALEKIDYYQYDCIVLDIMLPDGSGLALLEHLKATDKTDGVIIISARNELDDKIAGLQSGADDYLTKPFHLSELSVRIAAIVRRKNVQGSKQLLFEDINIDLSAKTVTVNDIELLLTRKEYELLLYFVINKNKVLSKNAIAGHLWGDDMDMADNHDFIYTHVKNLRKKLLQSGTGDYIHNVYGMGYKFSYK